MISYDRKTQTNERTDIMSLFSHHTDLVKLFEKHGCKFASYVNFQIGFDGRLYLLFNEAIPERIDGMFVPTTSDSRFCVLALDVDWDSEQLTGEHFYDLGTQKMNYHFVQPVSDGLLLVASRCRCKDDVGELNATVFDGQGGIIREYCLGDGITDAVALADDRIITGYFDEGVFGNYGWIEPLGASGLVVWDKAGNITWESDKGICECYAMNVDDGGRLWYYYYTEFDLVCTDLKNEKVYQPGISGSNMLILPADGQSVIFDAGYQKHGTFVSERLAWDSISAPEALPLDYEDKELSLWRYTSRGSLAAFIDTNGRLFVKRFVSV